MSADQDKYLTQPPENPGSAAYWDYLRLDRLLNLQGGMEDRGSCESADEMHFIVVHQVIELWFKQIIRELYLAIETMNVPRVAEERVPVVTRGLERVNIILKQVTDHFGVMETLTTRDFMVFRSKLASAGGFQSFQMREIELLMGLGTAERKAHGHGDPVSYIIKMAEQDPTAGAIVQRLKRARKGPSLHDVLNAWLYRTPIMGSPPGTPDDEAIYGGFLDSYLGAVADHHQTQLRQAAKAGEAEKRRLDASLREATRWCHGEDVDPGQRPRTRRIRAGLLFIGSYRELPLLTWPQKLLEAVAEMEELFLLLRFRHARMVERIIGRRPGTAGAGVDYLDATTAYRIFKDLWAAKTIILPADECPELKETGPFGFSAP